MADGTTLQVLDRALGILGLFTSDSPELTVTEVTERSGLPLPTASRLLAALGSKGYLHRDEVNRRYRLGPAARRLGGLANDPVDLREAVRPLLRSLVAITGETAVLWALDGARRQAQVVESTPSDQALRVVFEPGDHLPVHAGATGLLLLASMDDMEREEVLRLPLAAVTPRTDVDPIDVQLSVLTAKRRSWASDAEKLVSGAWTVAARVKLAPGMAPLVIGLHGPSTRYRRTGIALLVEQTTHTANALGDAVCG